MKPLLEDILAIVAPQGILWGADVAARSAYIGREIPLEADAIVRPASTTELSAVMALCHDRRQPVVTHGGRSGLVAGQYAAPGEIAISLERMNCIQAVDSSNRTVTVEAGAILQQVQEQARDAGMEFTLDLGARGSCTIGGNIATNAGGNQVIRHGMMREHVLGLEVVLADGRILCSMNPLVKNNTGYDLKQLFIGSEGTLGIVTGAVLKLEPLQTVDNACFLAVRQFDDLPLILNRLLADLGGTLSSFEVMWQHFYEVVLDGHSQHQAPLPRDYPFYILVESRGNDRELEEQRFETAIASVLENELAADAVMARNEQQRQALWSVRDDIEALIHSMPTNASFDISLSLQAMPDYLEALEAALPQRKIVFGHLGDGNLHIMIEARDEAHKASICDTAYELLAQHSGSISAEHGIGKTKKPYLHCSRNDLEIELMRDIKRTLDSHNLLNPGRIFDL